MRSVLQKFMKKSESVWKKENCRKKNEKCLEKVRTV